MRALFTGSGWKPFIHFLMRHLPDTYEVSIWNRTRPLEQAVAEVEFLLPSNAPFSAEVIAAARSVRLIQQPAAGVENIDLAAARARGIPVANAPGANQRAVAESALLLMLGLARRLPEAQRRFADAVALPEGYHVDWGGQFENLARARHRLAFILPITVLVIFALLFVTFGSVAQASLVLLNVPFSLVGGIVALYLRGINLSVSAAVGFISLFGVAVMSGVLVISEIRDRVAAGKTPTREAVVQGALAQMRPVLMMVVVAMLGMVPAAIATGVGSDVQRPLATVVVGGLLSTLVLTLTALPALYWLIVCRSGDTRA